MFIAISAFAQPSSINMNEDWKFELSDEAAFCSVDFDDKDWIHTVTYAPDVIQEKTLDFIKTNEDEPFFAYVPLVQPHAEMISKEEEIFNSFSGK